MPGLRGYVDRRLNRGGTGASQWDWLYGGRDRPQVFGGNARKRKGKRQLAGLHQLGYNPSPGTRFDPAQGTLGGLRQVVGTRPLGYQEKLNAMGSEPGQGGGLEGYRKSVIRSLYPLRAGLGGAVSADQGRGGADPSIIPGKGDPGSMAAGGPDINDPGSGTGPTGDYGSGVGPQDDTSASPYRRSTMNAPGDPPGPIGQPQTPMAQAIQLAMEETTLGNFGQLRALINQGVMGGAGMQAILEQIEGPENMMLADIPGRTEDMISQSGIRGADARRQILKGLDSGRAGAQRPGMAGQMVAQATIPQRMEESRYAGDITEAGYNMADQISLGQGERRGNLMQENMMSKLAGLQMMGGATGQAGGMLGERYWDPQSPYDMGLEASSRLAELQGVIGSRAASQQQRFRMFNDRMGNYYAKDQAGYNAQLQRWLENEFKRLGLGDYYESAADWVEAFMPDSVTISDARLKRDMESTQAGLEEIVRLSPKTFTWKGTSKNDVGLIAQEVQEIIPDAVGYVRGSGHLGIRPLALIAALVNSIKDLKVEIDTLKSGFVRGG